MILVLSAILFVFGRFLIVLNILTMFAWIERGLGKLNRVNYS